MRQIAEFTIEGHAPADLTAAALRAAPLVAPGTAGPCGHSTATLVATTGLGGWSPREIYRCDDIHCRALYQLDPMREDH